jgi:hypothetical protein
MFSQVIAGDGSSLPVELEPSAAELAAVEDEMPLVMAELAVTDAQIRIVTASAPSPLDYQRLRRARRRVLSAAVRVHALRSARHGSAEVA